MKKMLVFGMALLFLAPALFADDALVMPARVGRFYLAPSFIFGSETFDEFGYRVPASAKSTKMFNLGAALEYGINSWITGAVQWAPGANLWSEIDINLPIFTPTGLALSTSDVQLSDVGDLFVGAKIQLVGNSAGPAPSDIMRMAFAPGLKIPLGNPDFSEQYENAVKGDPVTAATLDKHILGLGLRTYFDWIINENFFINFYNEVIFYPGAKKIKHSSYQDYLTLAGVNAQIGSLASDTSVSGEVNYKPDLTFEIEPKFTTPIAEGVVFNFGLPVRYVNSGKSFNFTAAGTASEQALTAARDELQNETSHLVTFSPNLSTFFMGWPLPTEFKLTYSVPVLGQNVPANNVLNFQIRLYFRI